MKRILLDNICESITDGSHNPPQGIDSSEYLMLSSKNVYDDEITFEDPRFLSKDDFEKENKRTNLSEGDVLLTIVGTIGRSAVVGENLGNVTLQRSVAVLHPNKEKCNSRYLMYILRSKRRFFEGEARGVAQKGIYLKQLKAVETTLPELLIQNEVVKMLDTTQEIILKRKEQLEQLDTLIKSRFVELFGDPVENTMNWKKSRLGDLSIQINSGNTPKGGEQVYVDEGITFFRSQNVWKDRLEMEDVAFIDNETHKNMKRSSLKHGDILMTKTGRINTENSSLGRAALYLGEDDAANVNGHVYFIRLKPEINNEFVLKILVSKEYLGYIRSVCVGGIDKRQLNKNHIEDFPIICPPKAMQNKFIEFVHQIDKAKNEVQNALSETQKLFDSLMQKYFE